MDAGGLFKAGKLQEAIEAQIQVVKSQPADNAKRMFLFELLAFSGELERAGRQIDAVKYDEIELETEVMKYRKLLEAEQARRRLFTEGLSPKFLIEPAPEHVRHRLQAVNRLREGDLAGAAERLAAANEASPAVHGKLNDKPFAELRDCDDLFSHVLEVMAHGNYYWVPLEQVEILAMNAPKVPRDLLWVAARIELEGVAGDVFLPALYPGSHEHPDPQVQLGRMTDWKAPEGGPVLGVGSRLFLADEDEIGLLEWRELCINPPA